MGLKHIARHNFFDVEIVLRLLLGVTLLVRISGLPITNLIPPTMLTIITV